MAKETNISKLNITARAEMRHGKGGKLLQYSRLAPNDMAKEANSQEISPEIPAKFGTRPNV